MRTVKTYELKYLSFPDAKVENMVIQEKPKEIKVYIDGGWLDCSDGGQLGKGILYIYDWKDVSIQSFDPLKEQWSTIDDHKIGMLKDIPDILIDPAFIQLCGFSKKTGHWVKWEFRDPKISATFN